MLCKLILHYVYEYTLMGLDYIYFQRRIVVKKINWKILNFAFWIEVILSYVLPFKVVDNFQYNVGFPIPFISVYDTKISVNPLMSMYFNPLGLFLNGIITKAIYSGSN
jgi:hypothetical protein